MQPHGQPTRFPGKRRRRGTNWGLCNDEGNWLHVGPNIAAFDTAKQARTWLEDSAARGKDGAITFRYVEPAALIQ
jgi:hypothetical protein